MALITSIEQSPKERRSVHQPTRCLYAIVDGPGKQRFLQLDTVGSDDRQFPDKVSQSIQFDRQSAGQLIQLLKRAFPDLGGNDSSALAVIEVADEEEEPSIEGRTLFRLHRVRERDKSLVSRKKRGVLAEAGRLACEVCGFDFVETYGDLGQGFAECHHMLPLAELNEQTVVRAEDLAIVCANCHRMLHRIRPAMSVGALSALIAERRALASS